ncbi:MAG: PSD1 and planctomycete cytochrome C domain-containing protein, partial [Limisphaerales bacterium]
FRLPHFLLGLLVFAVSVEAAGKRLSFNRDVRPLLADHCFTCHGQDDKTRKGGLRLDIRAEAIKGGKSKKAAILPGEPDGSELIARVSTHEADDVMPPPDQKNPLSPAHIETLKVWIREGAEYQGHWAFSAPEMPAFPEMDANASVLNPIDNFVLAQLKQKGLALSPEARPETLIRRVSLDITGIPPSPKEIDNFIAEYARRGDGAYVDVVEKLLASERYAEKWARWWLDAARYADSDGYEKDLPREQWPWRDWVINSLHEDKPYDQFVIEQMAGDLLARQEPEFSVKAQKLRVATGFLRNGMINEEGAIINEQFRLEGMFDRMDVIGRGILGLTFQCAQCHTHKFDPVTHEEYFRTFAFVNDTYEKTEWVYSPDQLATIKRIHKAVAEKENEIKARFPDWEDRLLKWESAMAEKKVAWKYIDAIENDWVGGLAHPEKQKDKSILTLGFRPTVGELWVSAMISETNITGLRLEALTHGDLPFNGPGRSSKGTFAVSELFLEAAPIATIGANTNHAAEIKSGLMKIPLTNAVADIEAPDQLLSAPFARKDEKRRMGPAAFLIDGKDETAWSTDLGPGRRNDDAQVVMTIATNDWASADGTFLKFWLKFRHGGDDGHGRQNHFLGRFRLAVTTAADPHADSVPAPVRAAIEIPREQRTSEQNAVIFKAWRNSVPEFAELNEQLAALWKDFPEGDPVLSLAERDPDWHRETPIYDRGNWQKPTRTVKPGVPGFLHPLSENAPVDRLAFARWLVDSRSPTSARVAVNRVWQSIFGLGLVESPEDFGVRSSLPQHPELLDWLAVSFMEGASSGRAWSLKELLRTIVHSATYRQDSRASNNLLELDPQNKWLARGPRFRVEAEQIRDIALTASGLLHEKLGGRSFYPPVPESMFALNFVKIDWTPAPAPERYRRSLYLFRRRSMPDPVMANFDAPNGDFACVRRSRSNTPLAALASLNEPVFVEAAQALALRVLREGGGSDQERAAFAFRLCTGRAPRPAEVDAILNLLRSRETRIAEGWLPARELAVGDRSLPSLPTGTNPRQLAAWTVSCRVLLNLDETMTKN